MQEVIEMKGITFFLAVLTVLFLSGGLANAQQGHGAGGAMAGPGIHGDSGMHGNGNASATANSTGTSPKTASSQLTDNQHLDTALTNALGKLVPPGGLATACQGYSNLGRCISAIHVANNRKLDFFCLRKAMTGEALPTTDTTSCSVTQTNLKLGQAIQTLDPNANFKAEASKGVKQADTDIHGASHSQT
jgi:hypothetical protein